MDALGGIKGRVDRQLAAACRTLPPRLRAAFDRLLVERGLLAPDPVPYFAALGHPLFELPVWVAARLRTDLIRAQDLDRALGSSALGYLHARAQDDWLDGDARHDPTPVALADWLLARCTRLLAEVVGTSPRFWARYDDLMAGYAESLLQAEDLRRTGVAVTRAVFEQLLEQSRPLAIPSLALLDRAGRWDLAPALEEFVIAEAAAAQVFNDLTDYHRDRESGQRTWVVEAVDAGAASLWTDVLAGGGAFAERVGEALAYHDRSVRAAGELGLEGAHRWLAERRGRLDSLGGSLREGLLAAFSEGLAAAAEPGGEAGRDPGEAHRDRAGQR